MYECPGCGGNLKYHISFRKMYCAFCESQYDPYDIKKETDTVDGDCFETNVFSCPQCGGEMLSGDNDATSFCSYCGSANILSGRIGREKRPAYIIPFQVTKEECKKAYKRKMRRAFFAPKEMKNPDFIDGFRGIYMPYWSYRISQKGAIRLTGCRERSKGDYTYTDYYDLKGDLDAGYEGYTCDAASGFYDNISEVLGPYDINQFQEFTPSFLSGFYAETADVKPEVYSVDAEELATDVTMDRVLKEKAFRRYELRERSQKRISEKLNTQCEGADRAMFPVWFMSYRNGDKVAYATVNGQTGKVVADMPVDWKRFLVSSLLLAVPIFFLLNLFLTLRPMVLLVYGALLATAAAFVYYQELAAILRRESNEEDRGLQMQNPRRKKPKRVKRRGGVSAITLFVIWLTMLGVMLGALPGYIDIIMVWIPVVVIMGIICVNGILKYRKLKNLNGGYGFIFSAGAVLLGTILRLWKPVSDLWYYGGVVLILVTVIFILSDLVRNYNRLALRRMPQFDKKGGDDNA